MRGDVGGDVRGARARSSACCLDLGDLGLRGLDLAAGAGLDLVEPGREAADRVADRPHLAAERLDLALVGVDAAEGLFRELPGGAGDLRP